MRLWLTCREAGKPLPRFSDDDVLDYLVTEAIRIKAGEETKRAQQEQEGAAVRSGDDPRLPPMLRRKA